MNKKFKTAVAVFLLLFFSKSVSMPSNKIMNLTYNDLYPSFQEEIDCLAMNIYFEARSENKESQSAVAIVTLNRVNSEVFPTTVCGVVRQKYKNTCQFSWWCNKKLKAKAINMDVDKDIYLDIRELALDIYLNYKDISDNTEGALYYHAKYLSKKHIGVKKLKQTAQIGNHIFYTL
jgi:N-acetylmuramoyl-L-alanine amidase